MKSGLLSAVVSVRLKSKLPRITPIFKKGSTFDKGNYRPISVLSNFSKIIEKAMYHLFYRYLEDFKILYPFCLAVEKNLQPCMLLPHSLHQLASPLIIMNLVVAYLLI